MEGGSRGCSLAGIQRGCPSSQDQVRGDKALRQLNMAKDIKDSKKSFCRYVGDKQNTRKNEDPFKKERGDLIT